MRYPRARTDQIPNLYLPLEGLHPKKLERQTLLDVPPNKNRNNTNEMVTQRTLNLVKKREVLFFLFFFFN